MDDPKAIGRVSVKIDLDGIVKTVQMGRYPAPEVILAMRNELCAWRAAHAAGSDIADKTRNSMEPHLAEIVIIGALTYRSTIEEIMNYFGFPQDPDKADAG